MNILIVVRIDLLNSDCEVISSDVLLIESYVALEGLNVHSILIGHRQAQWMERTDEVEMKVALIYEHLAV